MLMYLNSLIGIIAGRQDIKMNEKIKVLSFLGLNLLLMTIVISAHLTELTYAISSLSGSFKDDVWAYVPAVTYVCVVLMLGLNIMGLLHKNKKQ